MISTAPPIRVMIVEDSAVVRRLLTHIINSDPRLTVAAAVTSGEEGIAALSSVQPDVISMDIRLPGIDGLETTRRVMADRPTPIVVIAASAGHDIDISMAALSAGALAVVEKPVGVSHTDYSGVAERICTQLRIMSQVAVVRHRLRTAPRERAAPARPLSARPRLIVCGASTGGPQALLTLLGGLPAGLPAPMLLVQHMGASFMPGFVRWLDGVVPQPVGPAQDGEIPESGAIFVAPGDRHLRLDRQGRMRITADAPVRGQRPAVTTLFESAAEHFGAAAAGIVLTGMGEDGAPGVRALLETGAPVLAEDETSAIVYGMPAAAVREGATPMPLNQLAAGLLALFSIAKSRA